MLKENLLKQIVVKDKWNNIYIYDHVFKYKEKRSAVDNWRRDASLDERNSLTAKTLFLCKKDCKCNLLENLARFLQRKKSDTLDVYCFDISN